MLHAGSMRVLLPGFVGSVCPWLCQLCIRSVHGHELDMFSKALVCCMEGTTEALLVLLLPREGQAPLSGLGLPTI